MTRKAASHASDESVPSDPPEATVTVHHSEPVTPEAAEAFFADDLTDVYGDVPGGYTEYEPSEYVSYFPDAVAAHKLIFSGTIGPNERKASQKFLTDHGVEV